MVKRITVIAWLSFLLTTLAAVFGVVEFGGGPMVYGSIVFFVVGSVGAILTAGLEKQAKTGAGG